MKIKNIINILKLFRDNKAVVYDVEYLSFLATLVPVPGIQQTGQAIIENLKDADKNYFVFVRKVES